MARNCLDSNGQKLSVIVFNTLAMENNLVIQEALQLTPLYTQFSSTHHGHHDLIASLQLCDDGAKVLDGLYVGGAISSPKSKQKLEENKITHILSIHDMAEPGDGNYVYKCIKCSDTPSTDLTQYYEECFEFIHQCRMNGGSVFIHCMAGISRSVTITAMYIMLVTSLDNEQALMIIKHCRPQAGPNFGFRSQLKNYYTNYAETERKKIREKYPHKIYEEDEKVAQQLLIDAKEKFVTP